MNPFSFTDFSGGITDKDIPGANNRYAIGDNFLIDQDGKLLQRDGFDIYSSTAYQLAAAERVARLTNFDIDSEIVAWQDKKVFAISAGAWAEVQGPGGGASAQHAFNSNTAASLLDEAQWQHHLFMASDSGDPVVKMFRDGSSMMQLRSAGLPEFGLTNADGSDVLTPNDGGLANAITLANDIRSKMITHFGANGATAGVPNSLTNGHHSPDTALAAQATAVTASTAATDLASLITLMGVLRAQYTAHIGDAQKEDPAANILGTTQSPFRTYHAAPASGSLYYAFYYDTATTFNQPIFQWRHYLNFTLADPNYIIPAGTTIANLLVYVNDLRDKWNWHTYATNTHLNAMKWLGSVNTKYGTHKTSVARVSTYSWAQITPNYGPLLQYMADLLTEFNTHTQDSDMHMPISDTTNVVDASFPTTPTTLWDAVCLLGGIADAFTYHAGECDPNFGNMIGPTSVISGAATTGAATKTISWASGGTADQYKYWNVVPIFGAGSTPFNWVVETGNPTSQDTFTLHSNYKITGSTNATPSVLTVPSNVLKTVTQEFLLTTMQFHIGYQTAGLLDARAYAKQLDAIDYTIGSAAALQAIADAAKDLSLALKAHATSKMAIPNTTQVPKSLKLNNNDFDIYVNPSSTLFATGELAYTHLNSTDDVNFPKLVTWPQTPMMSAVDWTQLRFNPAPLAASFNYKAAFAYNYNVGANAFTDRGAPSTGINVIGFINEDSGGNTETGKYAATIANLYAYANAANENWATGDTTNFSKEIYRTMGNGQNYYRIDVNQTGGSVTNATTSVSDYSSDTYLFDQLELYTNGGAPENNRPPAATNIHVFGNVMYYVLGNKVFQSIPNDPDSVPSGFFEEFEEPIIGVSSTRSVAVAFGKSRVYRLVGLFDELGRGSLTYERIFDRTGAISAQSIVKADNGIFFAGKDGFYFTDGYQCMRVTDMEKTFRGFTDTSAKRSAIQGTYDNVSKRVYWTIPANGSTTANLLWVLDIKFGIKPDATPVTTHSKTTGFNPTALTYFNGQLYYGDGDGYVYVQTRGRNFDLVKNTGVAATSWDVETTQWDFKSCHSNFGSEMVRKYSQRITAQFEQQGTNLSATITSDVDKGRVVSDLPVIRSRKLSDWGDSKIDWIASVYTPEPGLVIDEWRRFNGDGSLRFNYRSIEMKTAYCVIVKSGDMGTSTVANVAGNDYTVTLTSLVATRKWPLYSVGYFYRLNGVDYPITSRTSDSVVHIDATGLAAPAVGVATSWEIWGHPKNERARMIAYSIKLEAADENEHSSKGTATTGGANA